jgi:hypothetical protein
VSDCYVVEYLNCPGTGSIACDPRLSLIFGMQQTALD